MKLSVVLSALLAAPVAGDLVIIIIESPATNIESIYSQQQQWIVVPTGRLECGISTFSVVIAGEFNAGRSTLINAVLGTKII